MQVDYTPKCGHAQSVDCFLKQKYENKEQIFVCPETLDVVLPRCGHPARVPCDTALRLQTWIGTSATSKNAKGVGQLVFSFILYLISAC